MNDSCQRGGCGSTSMSIQQASDQLRAFWPVVSRLRSSSAAFKVTMTSLLSAASERGAQATSKNAQRASACKSEVSR